MQHTDQLSPAAAMLAIIREHDDIVIAAHGSPDGDAIGATGAMAYLLKALGKRFALYNATGIPEYLEWVPLPGRVYSKPSALPFRPGLIIALDCGDVWRLGKELNAVFADYPSISIDHHLSNPLFASLANWRSASTFLLSPTPGPSRTGIPARQSSSLPLAWSPAALTPQPSAKNWITSGASPRSGSGAS